MVVPDRGAMPTQHRATRSLFGHSSHCLDWPPFTHTPRGGSGTRRSGSRTTLDGVPERALAVRWQFHESPEPGLTRNSAVCPQQVPCFLVAPVPRPPLSGTSPHARISGSPGGQHTERRHHRRRTGRTDRRLHAGHPIRHHLDGARGRSIVGGISRTVERDGWRFDIGGHRFFTKVKEVEELLARDPARRGLHAAPAHEPDLLQGQVLRLPAEGLERPARTSASGRRSSACMS